MTGERPAPPPHGPRGEGAPALPAGRCLSACFDDETALLFAARAEAPAGSPRVRELHTCLSAAVRAVGAGGPVVGLRIARDGFDALLRQAVLGVYDPEVYPSKGAWRLATRFAQVTVTWVDRDGAGEGATLAPCLTLKGPLVGELSARWLVEEVPGGVAGRDAPVERPYPVLDPGLWARLGAGAG